jgi:hypothetical protein
MPRARLFGRALRDGSVSAGSGASDRRQLAIFLSFHSLDWIHSMETRTSEFDRRLATLESQNRGLRRLAAASLGLTALGLLVAAAAVCDSVSAERFVLRDSRGRERVRLTAYETGGPPRLTFLDEEGKEVFGMGVCEQGRGFIEVVSSDRSAARSNFAVVDGRAVLEPALGSASVKSDRAGL